MEDKKLRKFKLIDKEGYLENDGGHRRIKSCLDADSCFTGFMKRGILLNKELDWELIIEEEFKFFKEITEEKSVIKNNNLLPKVGEKCRLFSLNNVCLSKDLYTVHEYSQGSQGKQVVLKDENNNLSLVNLDPKENIKLVTVDQNTFGKILSQEYDIIFTEEKGVFKIDNTFTEDQIVSFAKEVLKISEEK